MTTGGFTMVPNTLISDEELSGNAKLVYLAIALHTKGNTGEGAHPSYRRIATVSGVSRATVGRALHELEERGYLTIERRREPGKRERASNAYRLHQGRLTQSLRRLTGELQVGSHRAGNNTPITIHGVGRLTQSLPPQEEPLGIGPEGADHFHAILETLDGRTGAARSADEPEEVEPDVF